MKKLMMFAAAMTIVGGAFAQNCAPVQRTCALVYYVKMNLRTSMGKGGVVGNNANVCAPGTAAIACVRVANYPYVINGIIYTCDCTCDSIGNALDNDGFVLWDPKWHTTVFIDSWTWTSHVIGKKTSAEVYWTLNAIEDRAVSANIDNAFTLYGAGFGVYNGHYYTGFSGYAAGTLMDPICQSVNISEDDDGCARAGYWYCDDGALLSADTEDDDLEPAPLFGKWAIKLNAAASKRYLANATLPVPNYVSWEQVEVDEN